MLGFVKMSALSAVLSFGVVTAYNQQASAVAATGEKLYQDRVLPDSENAISTGSIDPVPVQASLLSGGRKGDRLADPSRECTAQAWPYVAQACLTRTDGRRSPDRVRVITVEMREGKNTSVLQRIPQTDIARR